MKSRLIDLPLGTHFRFIGYVTPDVFVLLSHEDCGKVTDGKLDEQSPRWGICSAAESRAEFEKLVVETVRVQEVKS